MVRLVGMAVVGLGLMLAAGCECGCAKSACPMPENAKENVSAWTAPADVELSTIKNQI